MMIVMMILTVLVVQRAIYINKIQHNIYTRKSELNFRVVGCVLSLFFLFILSFLFYAFVSVFFGWVFRHCKRTVLFVCLCLLDSNTTDILCLYYVRSNVAQCLPTTISVLLFIYTTNAILEKQFGLAECQNKAKKQKHNSTNENALFSKSVYNTAVCNTIIHKQIYCI